MSKYIPDISSRRWVIVSSQRLSRPDEHASKKSPVCPFCPGNERLAKGEVFRFGHGLADGPGWTLRVIPNKYPITDIHEVIIHSPDNEKDIHEIPVSQVELVIRAYKARFNFHKQKGSVIIFCNHGEHAGASIKHPHSQLVVIPSQINLDALSREPLNNIVAENKFFNVYCPDFSQWPYEAWIAPKIQGTFFGDINDEEITDLADILQKILKRLKHIYHESKLTTAPFGYNFYIYPKESWYLRIIPRFIHRAGFELGTGLSVNIVDPIDAALELKGVEGRIGKVLKKLEKRNK